MGKQADQGLEGYPGQRKGGMRLIKGRETFKRPCYSSVIGIGVATRPRSGCKSWKGKRIASNDGVEHEAPVYSGVLRSLEVRRKAGMPL